MLVELRLIGHGTGHVCRNPVGAPRGGRGIENIVGTHLPGVADLRGYDDPG